MHGATELYIRCMSEPEREEIRRGIQAQREAAAGNRLELLRIDIFAKACEELWAAETGTQQTQDTV